MRRVVIIFFLGLNIFIALGLIFTYVAPHINPQDHWVPSLFALAYPYLLVVNILFIILWFLFYWRYTFVSLLTILAGSQTLNTYIRFSSQAHDDSKGIKVLSYNVKHFYSYLDNKKSKDGILDFIAAQNADIICLQETKLQKEGALNPIKLKSRFPGIAHCQLAHMSTWGGPVTFSRYPIINMGEIRFEGSPNMIIFSDINTGSDTLRVYNCHLQSFRLSSEDYSIIDSISFEPLQVEEVKSLGNKIRLGNIRRVEQIEKLIENLQECPYKNIIVCGDFNDTPNSYTYYQVKKFLTDSFIESGYGISNTFREKIAPYRIDYIFHSSNFVAHNYTRYKVSYSDHFPISAILVKK